ncbi:MAG: ParB/RepB/Spo0J family partition protein [Oscillospiraceae bacterium]|nr:ParB/RepB/Spo0J family partition protein [Oscillospiraceae bacterium]
MILPQKRGVFESCDIFFVPVSEITPNPAQPRKRFDPEGLMELAASIKRYGVLQPLSIRRAGYGYELVSGERRLRAALLAGLDSVPCIVLGVDAPDSSVLALVENLHRRDLDFIEEAEGIDRLIREFNMSQEEAARRLGKSQPAIANKLRILRLPPELLRAIRERGLTERHARALLRLDSNSDRAFLLKEIVERGLNVAKTEELIDAYMAQEGKIKGQEAQNKPSRPVYVLKDVRFFLNTVTRGMDLMKQSGIRAEYGRSETETDIILTIKIPKAVP